MTDVRIPGAFLPLIDAGTLNPGETAELERGVVRGRELSDDNAGQFSPFTMIGTVIHLAEVLGEETPESFIGTTIGIRGDEPVSLEHLAALRDGYQQGTLAAKADTTYPPRPLDHAFFSIVEHERRRMQLSARVPSLLETFMGHAIGTRTYLRAKEART